MGYRSVVVFLAIASLAICTSSAGGLNAIGDDELVEQIKSNEFLIVLFSKFDQLKLIYCNRIRNFFINHLNSKTEMRELRRTGNSTVQYTK